MIIDWRSFLKHRTPDDKNAFPVGSRVYFGHQGQGKSLAMVAYAFKLKHDYPRCVVFSNMVLNGIDYHLIKEDEDVKTALSYQNGKYGVLVLLDEAHLYFNKKNGISLDVLTAISQQRKDRRRIVFSSQIWEELDISLRKQVKEIVHCKKLFNMIIQTVQDGETLRYNKLESTYEADKIRTEIFKMNDEYYNRYNTYQKIVTNEEMVAPSGARTMSAPHDRDISLNIKKGLFR